MYKKRKNQGFVLVSTLVFIIVVVIISIALLQRVSTARTDVTNTQLNIKANFIAEKILNKAIDYISAQSKANTTTTTIDIAKSLSGDWLTRYPETGISIKTTSLSSLGSNTNYNNYITAFNSTANFMGSSTFSQFADKNNKNSYMNNCRYNDCLSSTYNITDGTFKGVFETFAIPIGAVNITDKTQLQLFSSPVTPHVDLIKVSVNVYSPTKEKYLVKKTMEIILRRPAGDVTGSSSSATLPDAAIAAEGNVTVNGGPTIISSPTPGGGNIHSNSSIVIQAGSMDGNLSASNSITEDWGAQDMRAKSMKIVPKIDIPVLDIPKPTTATSVSPNSLFASYTGNPESNNSYGTKGDPLEVKNTTINGNVTLDYNANVFGSSKYNWHPVPLVLENVVINGDLELRADSRVKLVIKGNVYVTGKVLVTQGATIQGGSNPNGLVAEKEIEFNGGTVDTTTGAGMKTLYMSKSSSANAIKITQGTKMNGVFYTSSPTSGITVDGGAQIFGAVISKGTATVVQGGRFTRDTNLGSITATYGPVSSAIDTSKMGAKTALWNQVR